MKLYGVWFSGRYSAFDSYHKAVSKKLFKTFEEAEAYIPEYKEYIINLADTIYQGFYTIDTTLPIQLEVIEFEL